MPAVLKDGEVCTDCSRLGWDGNNLTFNVTGFSNYTTTNNSELVIWDSGDIYPKIVNEEVIFYGSYRIFYIVFSFR